MCKIAVEGPGLLLRGALVSCLSRDTSGRSDHREALQGGPDETAAYSIGMSRLHGVFSCRTRGAKAEL